MQNPLYPPAGITSRSDCRHLLNRKSLGEKPTTHGRHEIPQNPVTIVGPFLSLLTGAFHEQQDKIVLKFSFNITVFFEIQ